MNILLLLAGLVVLVASGEVMVRGAAGIALKAQISPLVVGLTVVSIGTSAPELFASVTAALDGSPGLAIGNVVGSNIANLALVLGITAIIYPIPVGKGLLYFDGPIMVAVSGLLIFFMWDTTLQRWEGVVLVILMVLFIIAQLVRSRQENRRQKAAAAAALAQDPLHETGVDEFSGYGSKSYFYLIALVLAGCTGLYFGSDWFVSGASNIADSMGVSDHVIGVTVVAFGTSVPELAASAIAALRKQTDISIGNLVGSNIFNILSVLGITTVISDMKVDPEVLASDVWWMLGIALLIFPLIRMGYKIVRWEGILLVVCYVLYIFFVLQ
jgi:cation:H+ antiporter